jgi:hypothetical protein
MFLSHLTAKPRDPKEIAKTRSPRSEGNAIQFTEMGRAKKAERHSSPETVPEVVPSAANLNDATMIGQLTVSYRLLPFSGRTPVGTPPKSEGDAVGVIERFKILRLNEK